MRRSGGPAVGGGEAEPQDPGIALRPWVRRTVFGTVHSAAAGTENMEETQCI